MMHDVQTALKMLDARGGELDKKVAEIIREAESDKRHLLAVVAELRAQLADAQLARPASHACITGPGGEWRIKNKVDISGATGPGGGGGTGSEAPFYVGFVSPAAVAVLKDDHRDTRITGHEILEKILSGKTEWPKL